MRKLLPFILMMLLIGINSISAQNSKFLSFKEKKITESKPLSTMPQRNLTNTRGKDFIVEYNFNGCLLSSKNVQGENYNFMYVEGYSYMNEIGKPAVPAHNDLIAISSIGNVKIEILEANYIEYDNIYIHPALKPERDTYGAKASPFEKDNVVYNTDSFFPKNIVEITNVQDIRNIDLAVTQIRPVQFNPVTKKVRVYSKIKYKIVDNAKSIDGSSISQNSEHFNNQLNKLILNNSFLPKIVSRDSESISDGKNYIIVTHSEYAAAADSLAQWKRQMGYTVEVVSQDSWTTTQVKEAIHSRYNSWTLKPDYFVIIGDHDGNYAVPGEIHQDPNDGDDFATDLYYACFGGASDYTADIAHGRISVSSAAEAMIVVKKTINYERNPVSNPNFYTNGLNCAQFQDVANDENPDGYAARRFCHTSEDIRDYMTTKQAYTVERIYYTDDANTPTNFNDGHYSNAEAIPDELLKANGYKWDGGPSDIKASIDAGKFYVFHRDHGYPGGIGWSHPEFLSNNSYGATNNVATLENGNKLPVLFSINCHTGEFALPNCFAEEFHRKADGGAVGVIAAAYYSYSGYNDGFSAGMIDAIWSNPGLTPTFGAGGVSNPVGSSANNTYTMGDVMNQGLMRMVEIWGDNQYTWELFHWFGDPAMKIWTSNPYETTIDGNIPDVIENFNNFSISNINVNGIATIVADGELIGSAVIVEGACDINLDGLSTNATKILLTISKHNFKPLIKELSLISNKPVANFSADKESVDFDTDSTIHLQDESNNYATSWDWTISPGKIGVDYELIESTTLNDQNPVIKFSTAGYYSVALQAINSKGIDTLIKENYLKVDTIASGANKVTFNITSATSPVQNAQVYILGLDTLLTNVSGVAVYDSVPNGLHYTYTVIADGYMPETDTIDISGDFGVNHELTSTKTIAEIQNTSDASGISPYNGKTIHTEGVVTGKIADKGLFIQSNATEWGGIFVDTTTTEDYYVGDKVSVRGLVLENNTFTTIKNPEIKIISRWNETNSVAVSSTQALTENMEGMLVTIENIECSNVNLETGYWQVGDNKDSIAISKSLYDFTPTEILHYKITGVIYNKEGENVIIPREEKDIELLKFNLTFKVKDATGKVNSAFIKSDAFTNSYTDSNGEVLIKDFLPQKEIKVTVTKSGYLDYTETFDMDGADLIKNITLTALPRYSVYFTVIDEDSEPVENADVYFSVASNKTTDASGKVSYSDLLPANDLSYGVSATGYQSNSGTLSIVDQNINKSITLQLIRYYANFEVSSNAGKVSAASVKIGSETINTDANGKAVFELVDGEYAYEVSKSNFYTKTGTISINGDDNTEKILIIGTYIKELESIGISLYPNPNNGIFTLEGEKLPGSIVKIIDLSGRVVYKQKLENSSEIVNFTSTKGIYLIEIDNGKSTVQGKLIVQ